MKELRILHPEKRFAQNYKPDFVNLENRIAIEIDGDNHNNPKQRELDKKKTLALNYYGYGVFRFTNNYVINKTEKFKKDIEVILKECMEN